MKTSITLACAALGTALILSSCVAPYPYYAGPNQATGGVLGAATGGIAGAIIGNQSGRPLEGAAIGGAIGAIAGSALGYADDAYRYGYQRPAPANYYYRAPAYYYPPPVYAYPSYSFSYSSGPRCYYPPRNRCY
jgi:hypothetical protein